MGKMEGIVFSTKVIVGYLVIAAIRDRANFTYLCPWSQFLRIIIRGYRNKQYMINIVGGKIVK
jgi:hypothetical protein